MAKGEEGTTKRKAQQRRSRLIAHSGTDSTGPYKRNDMAKKEGKPRKPWEGMGLTSSIARKRAERLRRAAAEGPAYSSGPFASHLKKSRSKKSHEAEAIETRQDYEKTGGVKRGKTP